MNIKLALATLLITVATSSHSFANNKHKVPTETQGLTATELHSNNLGAQINVPEYNLRARRVILIPGATVAPHSHAERPGFVYVERGLVIESRNGRKRRFREGDTWLESASTNHWVRNPRKVKEAVLIIVDLPQN